MLQHLQMALVAFLRRQSAVTELMHTAWAWPIAESLHFLGLSLLIGSIGAFDLRLLGIGARIPIAAVHRLIPWGIFGFLINVATGMLFVLAEPEQYIYNPSFHLKLLVLAVAGVNAMMFYVTSFRTVFGEDAVLVAPARARVIAVISLTSWVTVIVCGRLLTFYRPVPCLETSHDLLLVCSPEP